MASCLLHLLAFVAVIQIALPVSALEQADAAGDVRNLRSWMGQVLKQCLLPEPRYVCSCLRGDFPALAILGANEASGFVVSAG